MIGLLAMAAAGVGEFATGNTLYRLCQPSDSVGCTAYVIGVNDATSEIVKAGVLKPSFCASQYVTPQQEADLVANYLRDHPESRDRGAAGLVSLALSQAFPCPK